MKKKSGFTLMEIMVVIIVIAVLASVAGPMIGSITDQGRSSATKSKLSALKSAMLAYQSDVGRLPHTGVKSCSGCTGAYDAATVLCHNNPECNALTTNADLYSRNVKNYDRKWKGPYMDSDPSDFMYDSWGNAIIYIGKGKNVYLWSYGADGEPYQDVETAFKDQTAKPEDCDDIVISVARRKGSITD